MAIRAQPVKSVFQRMPRLVREIAGSTGKQVRLVMEGENTEVDKTIIERLSDPITHMPAQTPSTTAWKAQKIARPLAKAKKVWFASLRCIARVGIVIEVSDDGRGINRPARA